MSKKIIRDAVAAQVKVTHVMDAEDGLFFARELEFIKAKSYDKKYADLPYRSIFPISHDAPEGSENITVSSYDRVGTSKIIEGYATDLPRVDIRGKQFSVPVKQTGNSYGYTTKEIRSSRIVGKSLDQRRANASVRANEELNNTIAFNGDSDSGLLGLFSVGGIPTATVATKAATGTVWANATPDEILYDLNNAVATMVSLTKMKEQPNRLLLPVLQYNLIASTPRSALADKTILAYFIENNPHISDVMPINQLDGAGTGGADVFVIYNPDPDNLTFEIPMEFRHLPPQLRGLEWQIPGEAETGGLNVYYPLSLAIWEGI